MTTKYTLYFDMDGTIADLYNVPNWLDQLHAESPNPYLCAKPMLDMERLQAQLLHLQKHGCKIVICSWLSIGASPRYSQAITEAKLQWLEAHLPQVTFDDYLFLEYGEGKHKHTKRNEFSLLFDDSVDVRRKWDRASCRASFTPSNIDRTLDYLIKSI